jgi:hypothetical protein
MQWQSIVGTSPALRADKQKEGSRVKQRIERAGNTTL